jgi:tRNA pseudouridine38-40 synthase
MSRVLKIVLAYEGTGLAGWQRQPAGASVQALLEDALTRMYKFPIAVTGAGRTDAGAHALGQVASCRVDRGIEPADLARALNARLPGQVRVLSVEEAPGDFHARYSARSKTYRYLVLNDSLVSPFARRYVWPVSRRLDAGAMAEAAAALVGTRDFAALQGAGSGARTTVRTIGRAEVTCSALAPVAPGLPLAARPPGGRLIAFEMSGDGFLRHMVRNAVGTLVEIGAGRREPSSMAALLDSRDRRLAGPTAPAAGLFLVCVEYDGARGAAAGCLARPGASL